ncbi:hypothetical protein ACEV7C_16145 [Enterobacter ludwigii]|uniref:hypothetical protein n=1 Tax=Enterobacter ludwigii TaxID=299767 RepID=UPI003BEF0964
MNIINLLKGPISGPYVYFIFTGDFVYIGETQRHPVIRWGAHLTAGGTLWRKLQENSKNIQGKDLFNEDFTFISINCNSLFKKSIGPSRIVSQALEHNLHCVLKSNPSLFGWDKVILSNTDKTAPMKFNKWQDIEKISMEIVEKVIKTIN